MAKIAVRSETIVSSIWRAASPISGLRIAAAVISAQSWPSFIDSSEKWFRMRSRKATIGVSEVWISANSPWISARS